MALGVIWFGSDWLWVSSKILGDSLGPQELTKSDGVRLSLTPLALAAKGLHIFGHATPKTGGETYSGWVPLGVSGCVLRASWCVGASWVPPTPLLSASDWVLDSDSDLFRVFGIY